MRKIAKELNELDERIRQSKRLMLESESKLGALQTELHANWTAHVKARSLTRMHGGSAQK